MKALRFAGGLGVVALSTLLGTGAPAQEAETPWKTPAELQEPADPELGRGRASWYGPRFHGRHTANGERFDMHGLTAAHPTLPFGTRVRVLNEANGREVVVRINDRGPHIRGRIIDLSRAAAAALGFQRAGEARVVLIEHRRAAPAMTLEP